jgi:hypothetical protein
MTKGQLAMIAAKLATLPPHRPLGSASIEALSQPEAAMILPLETNGKPSNGRANCFRS